MILINKNCTGKTLVTILLLVMCKGAQSKWVPSLHKETNLLHPNSFVSYYNESSAYSTNFGRRLQFTHNNWQTRTSISTNIPGVINVYWFHFASKSMGFLLCRKYKNNGLSISLYRTENGGYDWVEQKEFSNAGVPITVSLIDNVLCINHYQSQGTGIVWYNILTAEERVTKDLKGEVKFIGLGRFWMKNGLNEGQYFDKYGNILQSDPDNSNKKRFNLNGNSQIWDGNRLMQFNFEKKDYEQLLALWDYDVLDSKQISRDEIVISAKHRIITSSVKKQFIFNAVTHMLEEVDLPMLFAMDRMYFSNEGKYNFRVGDELITLDKFKNITRVFTPFNTDITLKNTTIAFKAKYDSTRALVSGKHVYLKYREKEWMKFSNLDSLINKFGGNLAQNERIHSSSGKREDFLFYNDSFIYELVGSYDSPSIKKTSFNRDTFRVFNLFRLKNGELWGIGKSINDHAYAGLTMNCNLLKWVNGQPTNLITYKVANKGGTPKVFEKNNHLYIFFSDRLMAYDIVQSKILFNNQAYIQPHSASYFSDSSFLCSRFRFDNPDREIDLLTGKTAILDTDKTVLAFKKDGKYYAYARDRIYFGKSLNKLIFHSHSEDYNFIIREFHGTLWLFTNHNIYEWTDEIKEKETECIKDLTYGPNPTSSTFKFSFESSSNSLNLKLHDANGKLLKNIQRNLSGRGIVEHDLDISELPKGLYYLVVITNCETKTIRIMKS